MLNDGWDEGMTTAESDAAAEEMYRDSHPVCLECEQPGCIRQDCPSSFCEVEALTTCHGELVHAGCVERFKAHIENRCDGTTCHCPAVPDAAHADPTCKTVVEAPVPMASLVRRAVAAAVLLLAGLVGQGCAAHAPAPEVEAVGQLAPSYHSIAVAPVHHDAPPELGTIVDTGSDDATDTVTTTTRVEAADASTDAAPEVVGKGGGLQVGAVR